MTSKEETRPAAEGPSWRGTVGFGCFFALLGMVVLIFGDFDRQLRHSGLPEGAFGIGMSVLGILLVGLGLLGRKGTWI